MDDGRIAGIGPATLAKIQERAKLLSADFRKPYLTAAVELPAADKELFFDIEVDSWRDFCYLHGFVERQNRNNDTEDLFRFSPLI